MNTLELFCGTKSFSKVMEKHNFETTTVDIDKSFNPDFVIDLSQRYAFGNNFDIIWASPPCTGFSVASIRHHWKDNKPISETSEKGILLLDNTIKHISAMKPKFWFIENPRGMMRIVIDEIFKKYGITDYRRVTVTYCQYGDSRMKPTDIWTNLKGWQGRSCKNGSSCHESAPRGSRTGTQGLKNSKDRGVIPPALFEDILITLLKTGDVLNTDIKDDNNGGFER